MGGSVDVLLPDHRLRGWRQRHEPLPIQPPFPIEAFTHDRKRLSAIRGLEHGRWHLSISHPMRLPTWAEVGEARDAWVVVRPRDAAPLRTGPPRPIPRVVVRDLGHVESPPEDPEDVYGGEDWRPRTSREEGGQR